MRRHSTNLTEHKSPLNKTNAKLQYNFIRSRKHVRLVELQKQQYPPRWFIREFSRFRLDQRRKQFAKLSNPVYRKLNLTCTWQDLIFAFSIFIWNVIYIARGQCQGLWKRPKVNLFVRSWNKVLAERGYLSNKSSKIYIFRK
jgi:hypothetical protein